MHKFFKLIILLFPFLFQTYEALANVNGPIQFVPLNSEFDNKYPEERFNFVLDLFEEYYSKVIKQRGGALKIKRDWGDGAVNAFAWRDWENYHLEILGGAARYSLATEDAFILLICHEMGHLLGGKPGGAQISYEAQADYFATAKCTRHIFQRLPEWKNPNVKTPDPRQVQFAKTNCQKSHASENDQVLCLRGSLAGLQLASMWAKFAGEKTPLINTPDERRASRTNTTHPQAQCRLDTYLAGALCQVPADEDFSFNNVNQGACHSQRFPQFARPACWYNVTTPQLTQVFSSEL